MENKKVQLFMHLMSTLETNPSLRIIRITEDSIDIRSILLKSV